MRADIEASTVIPEVRDLAVSVITQADFIEPPSNVWNGLLLYEEIEARPPWHLRLLLPVPIGNEGRVAEVGDTVGCLYETGRLVKRATRLQENRLYEFDVIEQDLPMGGGVRLSGGGYTLSELDDGGTRLSIETRYLGSRRPRRLWEPVERLTCRAFHRHLLHVIRQRVAAV